MTSNSVSSGRNTTLRNQYKDGFIERLDMELLLRAIRKRWLLAVVLFCMCMVAGGFFYIKQTKIYRAVATVEIDTKATDVLDVQEVYTLGTASWQDVFTYMDTQLNIIRSRYVLQRVVEKLNLANNMEFLGIEKLSPAEQEAFIVKNRPDPAEILSTMIVVERLKDTNLVKIACENKNPLLAQQISNMIAEVYVEQNVERKLLSTRQALDWLGDQTGDIKEKLEKSERDLYQYKRDNNILSISLDDRISITAEQLNTLSAKLSEARSETIKLQSLYEQIRNFDVENIDNTDLSFTKLENSEVITRLKIRLSELNDEYSQLQERYGPNHPEMKRIKERLETAKAALKKEIKNVVNSIRTDFQTAQGIEKGIAEELEKVKQQAFEIGDKELQYNRLMRERDTNQQIFNLVLKRLKETSLTSALKNNNVRVLDAAVEPKIAVKPNKMVIGFAAMLLGLIIAMGAIIALELMDKTIKNPEEIEKELGVTLLGIIPTVSAEDKNKPGFSADNYALSNPRSSFAESIRSIRTNLLFMVKGQERLKGRESARLLITSPSPREGKTTIAANMAIALSSAGQRVLVIDSDMRRPRLSSAFNIPRPDVGLSSLIVGQAKIEDAIVRSEHENLDILPCGPIPPNPAELLGSKAFELLINRLSEQYNMLIFDSPPVIAVTDAKVISPLMDGIVLVAKAGHTHKAILNQANRSLQEVNAPLWGIVLNDLDPEHREYGYYYRYYYRYGYYYGEDGQKTKKKRRIKVSKSDSGEA